MSWAWCVGLPLWIAWGTACAAFTSARYIAVLPMGIECVIHSNVWLTRSWWLILTSTITTTWDTSPRSRTPEEALMTSRWVPSQIASSLKIKTSSSSSSLSSSYLLLHPLEQSSCELDVCGLQRWRLCSEEVSEGFSMGERTPLFFVRRDSKAMRYFKYHQPFMIAFAN